MNRSQLKHTGLVTLLAFGGVALWPQGARADVGAPAVETETAAPAPVRERSDTPPLAENPLSPGHLLLAQVYAPPPPPPGYYVAPPPPAPYYVVPARRKVVVGYEDRPRWGLFGGGLGMFLAAYLPTMLIGVSLGSDIGQRNFTALAVPVAGPLFYLDIDPVTRAFLVFDTLIQAGGLAMLIVGLAAKRRVPVYERVAVAPLLSPNVAGVAAAGYF